MNDGVLLNPFVADSFANISGAPDAAWRRISRAGYVCSRNYGVIRGDRCPATCWLADESENDAKTAVTSAYAVRSKYWKLPWIWAQVIVTRPYSTPHGLNSVMVWFVAL